MLLEQDGGVVAPVLRKLGAEPGAVRAGARRRRSTRCRADAGAAAEAAAGSSELAAVLNAADGEMRALDDDYVSTEHLLLALAAHPGPRRRRAARRRRRRTSGC